MVYSMYTLESPQSGNSNENAQYTFKLKLLLLLYCCFTSMVNIKGHVGTVQVKENRKYIPIMPPDLVL